MVFDWFGVVNSCFGVVLGWCGWYWCVKWVVSVKWADYVWKMCCLGGVGWLCLVDGWFGVAFSWFMVVLLAGLRWYLGLIWWKVRG